MNAAWVQLIILIAVFLVLPILLYGIVQTADAERRTAQSQIAIERTVVIAKSLEPALEHATPAHAEDLPGDLARFQGEDLSLKLFFRPSPVASAQSMFLVAAAPALNAKAVQADREDPQTARNAQTMISLCNEADTRGVSLAGTATSLITLVRIRGAHGCWGLVTTSRAGAVPPIWSNAALQTTAAVYAAMVLLALSSAVRLLARLRSGLATVPAAGTAAAFPATEPPLKQIAPALSADSTAGGEPARDERETQPATPEAAVTRPLVAETLEWEPLEMGPPEADLLVAAPGLLDTSRGKIDISALIRAYLEAERAKPSCAGDRVAANIEDGIFIRGRADFLGTILSELVGGPLSAGAAIQIALSLDDDEGRRRALLTVEQNGAAGDQDEIGRLPHIKQFVAALGAVSAAERRADGGLTVRVAFPGVSDRLT